MYNIRIYLCKSIIYWIYNFIKSYGPNELLEVTGQTEYTDDAINKIAQLILQLGKGMFFNTEHDKFFESLFSIDIEKDTEFFLPKNFDEEGEYSKKD